MEDEVENEGSDFSEVTASMLAWIDPNDVGLSGLPILQEIALVLFILFLSTLLLLINSDFIANPFGSSDDVYPNSPSNVNSVQKHVPLPAVVLTKSQRRQISKLVGKESKSPLLVFVNTKSGGQTGELLLYRLKSLLSPDQVFDLIKDGGPRKGLDSFRNVAKFRILICGGDGSISWVLNELESCKLKTPCAVLPLGTGNDLAQVLGWGTGANNWELVSFLEKVSKSKPIKLDRWNVKISDVDEKHAVRIQRLQNQSEEETDDNDSEPKILSSYLGIGVDAQICLNFHLKRESQPYLFTSRILNKFWYASSGGKEIILQRFIDFSNKLALFCDGKKVKIPTGIEGIIVCNIRSYGGGVDLWGEVDETKEFIQNIKQTDSWGDSFLSGPENDRYQHKRRKSLNDLKISHDDLNNLERIAKNKSEFFSAAVSDGEDEDDFQFKSGRFNDGMLEIVGVQSSFQLGAAQVGLTKPTKLCQGSHLLIHVSGLDICPIQIDGEPFILKNDESQKLQSKVKKRLAKMVGNSDTDNRLNKVIEVSLRGQVDMLTVLRDLSFDFSRQNSTEVEAKESETIFLDVLRWAFDEGKITEEQMSDLKDEYRKRSPFKL